MRALGSRSLKCISRKIGLSDKLTTGVSRVLKRTVRTPTLQWHTWRPSLTQTNEHPSPLSLCFQLLSIEQWWSRILFVCTIWSTALKTHDDGDATIFVPSQRESRRESPEHLRCYFHPDTELQGCSTGFLLTLYGSAGGAATCSSSHGNRPELSDYCRCQGESAQQPTACTRLITFPSSYPVSTAFLLSFFFYTSCKR